MSHEFESGYIAFGQLHSPNELNNEGGEVKMQLLKSP